MRMTFPARNIFGLPPSEAGISSRDSSLITRMVSGSGKFHAKARQVLTNTKLMRGNAHITTAAHASRLWQGWVTTRKGTQRQTRNQILRLSRYVYTL